MKNDSITAKQMESMIALFLIGSSLVTGAATSAQQNTWFCIIIAFLLSIPLLWVHTQILELYPGRNYFENIVKACGKPVGKVICIILLMYSFNAAALVLKSFVEFIKIMNMPETPLIVIIVSIMGVGVYLMKKKLFVLARVSKFTLPFLIVSVVLTGILSYDNINFENLKPILKLGFTPMAKGTLLVFTLPFGESVILAPAFGALDHKVKIFPVFLKGALIAFSILLFSNLRNLLVLGESAGIFIYPSYAAISVISIGEFFTRIEVIIGINLLLAGFIKICVILFTCCKEVSEIFDFDDYIPLVAPCSLIIITLTMLVSNNSEEMMNWLKYHPVYCLPFQVAIPIAILITGKIRNKLQTKKKKPQKRTGVKPLAAGSKAAEKT